MFDVEGFNMSRYKDYTCEELPTLDGVKLYLLIIPESDPLFHSIGITDAVGHIGRSEGDEHPPDSIFVRQDIFTLDDCVTRLAEVTLRAWLKIREGEEGIFYYRTGGGEPLEQYIDTTMAHFKKLNESA